MKSAAEICEAVALDFKMRRITHQDAAKAIGKSKAVVSNQISGKKPFSKSKAELFAKAFDYNVNFLLYGEGELRSTQLEDPVHTVNATSENVDKTELVILVDLLESLLHLAGNQDAIDAWNRLMDGNYDKYKEKVEILLTQNKYNGRVPFILGKLIAEKMNRPIQFYTEGQPDTLATTNA